MFGMRNQNSKLKKMPNAFPAKRHNKTNKNNFKTKQRQLMTSVNISQNFSPRLDSERSGRFLASFLKSQKTQSGKKTQSLWKITTVWGSECKLSLPQRGWVVPEHEHLENFGFVIS